MSEKMELDNFTSEQLFNELMRRREVAKQEIFTARQAVKIFSQGGKCDVEAQLIISVVGEHLGVMPKFILGDSRCAEIVTARHSAMYLVKLFMGWSVGKIGRFFGKDHASVMYAVRSVTRNLGSDKEFSRTMEKMTSSITSATSKKGSDA